MHRNLYRGQMPECVQDAFTTLAAYNGITQHTRCTILRIIRDRADCRLIDPQPVVHLDLPDNNTIPNMNYPDPSLAAPCIILDTPIEGRG